MKTYLSRTTFTGLLLLAVLFLAAGSVQPAIGAASDLPTELVTAVRNTLGDNIAEVVTINETQKLIAGDPGADDGFGMAVAIDGDTAVIGAWSEDHDTDGSLGDELNVGAVYVFVRSGSTWMQQDKLIASDDATDDYFGRSVDIDGDTVVVGASREDHDADGIAGDEVNVGAVYVFTRSGTTWTEQAKLTASDDAANDWFGTAVSLEGTTLMVGASLEDHDTDGIPGDENDVGAVYVFTGSGASWTEQTKLTGLETGVISLFGYSISLSGNTVLIGAAWESWDTNGDTVDEASPGAAYVFTGSGASWSQQARLTASDAAEADSFGHSVSLSGDDAIIASKLRGYMFSRSASTWNEDVILYPDFTTNSTDFALTAAISGDTAILGGHPYNSEQGTAYLYMRSGGSWLEQAMLTASDGAGGDSLGSFQIAVSGADVLVAAWKADLPAAANAGAVYFYDLLPVAPSNLTATPTSQTEIELTWADNSDTETGFEVYRAPESGGSWVLIDTTAADVVIYQDSGLSCETSYTYQVRAVNSGGASGYTTSAATTENCTVKEMFYSQSTYDGWVLESGENTNRGGLINTTNLTCLIGDDVANKQYRTLLHFNTSRIPDDAVVTQIELQFKELDTARAGDPYATLGNLWADIKLGYFSGDAALVVSDFGAAASMNKTGYFVFTPSSTAYPIYKANLRATAFPYLNLEGITQFRLRFAIDDDNDSTADYIKIFCGDMPVPFNRPVLRVWYYVP